MKILMVCLGNICRSPLAEGILREKLKDTDAEVDSAGTSSYHVDEAPDPRAIKIGRKYGVNISDLRGRQFTVSDFDRFDRIYVMDESNYANVVELARNEADKNKVDFLLNELEPSSNREVPDPYFGGDQGFENVYRLLDQATDEITKKVKHGG
ncbi:MAG TPA: protein-tyrosine-phosphatase [Cryomorphaceae bacterium]|nr:protein-tyrosine-phosphatase [Owenweeksia sp.]HAD97194.1 protein-tyrosine-phosphatase [Cryomorphaceae bacterium]HBF19339.1 protein-tyrosine-phosphatase [Cryomorphaceae bacterium]HCQ17227.1 protein-tyrosine-phosphatase [Cryomorphaceae bacterium]|tara:strand:+ start:373 stop:831 length:459 start_codon:yes stop_codon:yes gene_type:complete